MSGLKLAALYSFPPHRFGLCGMGKSKTEEILSFLLGKRIPKIRETMRTFKGAFLYYKLIAKENKISDPFSKKVVRAYWIGNELLERVRLSELKKMVKNDFKKPKLAKNLPKIARAHHSFHVFAAGPLRKDLILTEGMKDLCKISWGKVFKIRDWESKIGNLIIEYQPLLKEKNWFLGKPKKRKIFWDKRILPKVKVGDFISFHWDLAIEKLSKKDIENLEKYTKLTLKLINQKRG